MSDQHPQGRRIPPSRRQPPPVAEDTSSADPGAGAFADAEAARRAGAEAQRRNAQRATAAHREAQLEAHTWRAVERLGELLEHEDPQVVLAAAHELLERGPDVLHAPKEKKPTRVTADDVEHEWERRRLAPRLFKGGAEALGG